MDSFDFNSKKIAVVFNECVKNPYPVLQSLEQILMDKGANPEVLELNEMKYGFDFVFAVGGDGTILHVAKFYGVSQVPVLGINLGRLGFLSQVNADEISLAVNNIYEQNYIVQKRLMLKSNEYTALNDFVIKGLSTSRSSKFVLNINGKFVCDYIADGLIISTPTGSTAYGLSAGGPVLYPKLNALVIVPICPHTLTARPIVVPADEKIEITSFEEDVNGFNLIIDGAESVEVGKSVFIEKSEHSAHLALLQDDMFYSVLRNKLNWGVAPKTYDKNYSC
ncbi:NAD(+)/NADH kinase [bacterium]|nr:NAD(+)/NADH kinase [bacterium]